MQYYLPIEINHDWYTSFILKSYGYQCCKTISIQLIDIKEWLLYWIVNISIRRVSSIHNWHPILAPNDQKQWCLLPFQCAMFCVHVIQGNRCSILPILIGISWLDDIELEYEYYLCWVCVQCLYDYSWILERCRMVRVPWYKILKTDCTLTTISFKP